MLNQTAQRVLVIDDDADIGQEICESLALKNFSGTHAENIAQARQRLAGEDDLSIVIVDYHMPGMNGIEVIEALRKETARRLVFIMLTGDDTQSAAINAVRAQAFDFLRKPVNVPTIVDAVCRASDHLAQLVEADHQNDEARVEALALKERVDTISEMLRNRENLLQRLLWTDRSALDPQMRKLGNDGGENHVLAVSRPHARIGRVPSAISSRPSMRSRRTRSFLPIWVELIPKSAAQMTPNSPSRRRWNFLPRTLRAAAESRAASKSRTDVQPPMRLTRNYPCRPRPLATRPRL